MAKTRMPLFAIRTAFILLLLSPLAAMALADETKTPSFTAVSPIFGELVAFSQPASFVPVFEDATADRYIREAVPKGETVEDWTQMITVTGAKGLAGNPEVTPTSFASLIADGFNKACPETFSAFDLGDMDIAGHKAFAAVVSCGSVAMGGKSHSETALVLAIKGASEYYTIQWAERTAASAHPPAIDKALWTRRLDELGPVRLCPIVPGEKAPYPSCVGQ